MLLRAFLTLASLFVVITAAVVIAGCSFNLPKNNSQVSTSLKPAATGPLAESIGRMQAVHPEQSGVAPLAHGADAFAARILLADAAVRSIDVQYYIWRGDLTGYLLLDRLRQAADRGVRVRLLLDDHGVSGLDPEIAALQAHPYIEVRLWNPFTLRRFKMASYGFDFFRLNRRMHNKSFTVDGLASIVGGRNVGDEYFGTGLTPLFVDLDVLLVGTIVSDISTDFDRYWNSPSAYSAQQIITTRSSGDPVTTRLEQLNRTEQMAQYRALLHNSDLVSRLATGTLDIEWTKVKLVSDDPAKGQGAIPSDRLLSGRMGKAVGTIERQFDGVSAYFVPGAAGVNTFAGLAQSGVQVRMLTNAMESTDVLPVHAGYAKRRKQLLEGGVELFELRRQAAPGSPLKKLGPFGSSGASLHAKTFAVDGQRIFIGSFNFDPRSAMLNTEMGVLIDSERLAGGLHQAFHSALGGIAWQVEIRDGKLVWVEPNAAEGPVLTREPGSNLLRNAAIKVIGWLPVEWLL